MCSIILIERKTSIKIQVMLFLDTQSYEAIKQKSQNIDSEFGKEETFRASE